MIAAGAVSADYGVPGVDEHAFGLKSLADAVALRSHVLRTFERAATNPELHRRRRAHRRHLRRRADRRRAGRRAGGAVPRACSRKDYPNLDVRRARIVLVETADRLLGTFAPRPVEPGLPLADPRGVEVVLGVGVDKVEADAVHLSDGTRIPAAHARVDGRRGGHAR